jgi:RNA polymerase sigma factor (sigma-70 family)
MKQNKQTFGTDEELMNGFTNDIEVDETLEIEDNDDEFIQSVDEIIYNDFEKKLELQEQELEDIMKDEDIQFTGGLQIPLEDAVQDFQAGEQTAFDYIFNHYKPKLERLAWRKNDEDLIQELSIVLLRAIQTFDIAGGAKFNTYFWKCARNHIGTLNIRRNAKKRTAEHGVVSMQQSFNTKDSEVELGTFIEDKSVESNYEQKLFRMILEENVFPYLKDNEVKAIEMLLNGYTLEEIGQALGGITAPAVHVKFRRLAEKKHVGKQLRLLYEMYCS